MKKTVICLIISLGVASLFLFLESKPFYQILDLKLYDLQMNLRKSPAEDPRILFVEMDEEAINSLGRWPWPRSVFAHIIDTLDSLGARQIVFDVTFSQPTQIIVDKEALGHIFQGKDQINDYITDEAGALKGKQAVASEDVTWTLNQIQSNFLIFADTAEHKLQNALIDNDKLLAESFKNSNSFIGYSFEVITEDQDIEKDRIYPQIKSNIAGWIGDHFEEPFDGLPSFLRKNTFFSEEELRVIFLRSKIRFLIEKNIEISLDKAAEKLGIDPKEFEPEFYLVKHQIIEKEILAALENNPQMAFRDIIYHLEIFDSATQQSFGEVWSRRSEERRVGKECRSRWSPYH